MRGAEAGDAVPAAARSRATPASRRRTARAVDARAELAVRNEIGLHARPAARFVAAARGFDADVRVAKDGDGDPVSARSLTGLVSLGARLGDTLVVTASGTGRRRRGGGVGGAGGRGVRRRGDRGRGAPARRRTCARRGAGRDFSHQS